MSNVYEYLNQCRAKEQQRIHRLKVERSTLKHSIDSENQGLAQNDAEWYVKEARARLATLTSRLAEVEEALASTWSPPSPKRADELQNLYSQMYSAQIGWQCATSALQKAIHEERPKAEAQVREELARCERDIEKYRKELRKGLGKVGVDPAALCGRIA
jgi:hypothetical protein